MSNRRRLTTHRGRSVVVPGVTLSLGLGMGALTCAPTAADTVVVDLLTAANIRIDGAATGDWSGCPVATAGDVNGDGLADVIIGAPGADNNGRDDSGSTSVVFGQTSPATVDLANLGVGGFRIDGDATSYGVCRSVAGAGDVNGDGLADVILGRLGASFVVFGKAGTTGVDLNALGADGFRIDGAGADIFRRSSSVARAGDVDGDGLDDVIIGVPWADNDGRSNSGSTYVVFGKTGTTGVDLNALGAAGFRIDGAVAGDDSGSSLAGAGDVNGDGLADVIIGAPFADNNSGGSGSSYVVFGRSGTAAVDLASLGAGGFRIDGATHGDQSGSSVAGAGDVNGDGLDDVIVGAPLVAGSGDNFLHGRENYSGSSYVVFGKRNAARVDLAHLGRRGFRIDGNYEDGIGWSVDGAGDVNGDGLDDVIVDANGREVPHVSMYVVFGKPGTARVDLADLGASGFWINGTQYGPSSWDVAGAGDVNGDGRPDVIVGLMHADNNGRQDSGSSYVVLGQAATVKVPKKIKPRGATVLLRKTVVTNAGRRASAMVTWSTKKSAGGTKKKYAKLTSTRSGKVAIRTTGKAKRLYVKLRLRAPAISGYAPYRFTATWTVKR